MKKFNSPPAAEQGIFDNVIAKASVDGEKTLRVLIGWKIKNRTAAPVPVVAQFRFSESRVRRGE